MNSNNFNFNNFRYPNSAQSLLRQQEQEEERKRLERERQAMDDLQARIAEEYNRKSLEVAQESKEITKKSYSLSKVIGIPALILAFIGIVISLIQIKYY